MLPTHRREHFDGEGWLFEPKWDGWRCIAVVRDGRARLVSRNGNDLTPRFPAVANALEHLPEGTVVDGEIVVLDTDGFPNFAALMRRQGSPCLLAFDLLAIGGSNICDQPFEDRKSRLAELVSGITSRAIQNTEWIIGEKDPVQSGEDPRDGGDRLEAAGQPLRPRTAHRRLDQGEGARLRPGPLVGVVRPRWEAATEGAGVMAEDDTIMPRLPPLAARGRTSTRPPPACADRASRR